MISISENPALSAAVDLALQFHDLHRGRDRADAQGQPETFAVPQLDLAPIRGAVGIVGKHYRLCGG